jgi:uncharacterized protein (TIGR02118 family)
LIKVSVLYPNGPGATFDIAYYTRSHMPMVGRLLGEALKRMEIDEGLGGMTPGSSAPYLGMCHLHFNSVEDFGAAFAQHGAAIQADIPNYTNTQPIIQISAVKM